MSNTTIDEFKGVRIIAPMPDGCPVCGKKHPKGTAHETDSLYYKLRVYRKCRMFPLEREAAGKAREGKDSGSMA